MGRRKIEPEKLAIRLGETFALAHFIVANLVMLIGELTSLFSFMGWRHPGVRFVLTYFDSFVYGIFSDRMAAIDDPLMYYLHAELVILLSSALYAFACWAVVRLFFSIYRVD